MRRRLLIGLLVAGALVVGVGAAPAAAHPTNPWTGAHTLCWNARQCVTQGNLVMLWQSVLYVDGSFVNDSTLEIDGSFGSRTHEATREWQSNHGIRSDGSAGPQTWGTAVQQLIYQHSDSTYHRYIYQGRTGRTLEVRQTLAGAWSFRSPRDGRFYDTSHRPVG